jgi:hypothetical protein
MPGQATSTIQTFDETGTIIDTLSTSFTYGTGASQVSGVFREVVVATGPNGKGPLDFLYQVAVSSKGTGANGMLNTISLSGFAMPISASVGQASSVTGLDDQGLFTSPLKTGTNPIMAASRSPGTGDGLNFFSPNSAGQTSGVAIVKTNATGVSLTPGTVTIDGHTLALNTFIPAGSVPLASVPEPVSLVLWGGGFAGLGVIGAARRRKAVPADA